MKNRRSRIRFLCVTAMMAACLSLLSPWAIPLGAIPCTLSLFALFLVSSLSSVWVAVTATAVYLMLGALGLPIFSSFQGGAQVFLSLSGGFLWGYLPAAFLVSFFARSGRWQFVLCGMLLGLLVIDSLGLVWFLILTETSLWGAIVSVILPFLLPDALKIAAVFLLWRVYGKRICFLKKKEIFFENT